MYVTLKRLYDVERLTEIGLTNAVVRGWITEAEKAEIML